MRLPLHDSFFAKSVVALKTRGDWRVLVLVTTHFTQDRQNAALRKYLGNRADFLGAVRLPSDAFKREGTKVVIDVAFLGRRTLGTPSRLKGVSWNVARPKSIVTTRSRGEYHFAGYLDDEEQAARAYDAAILSLAGEFARFDAPVALK